MSVHTSRFCFIAERDLTTHIFDTPDETMKIMHLDYVDFYFLIIAVLSSMMDDDGNFGFFGNMKKIGYKGNVIPRTRRNVNEIFQELGSLHKRYFRMNQDSFFFLIELLTPELSRIR